MAVILRRVVRRRLKAGCADSERISTVRRALSTQQTALNVVERQVLLHRGSRIERSKVRPILRGCCPLFGIFQIQAYIEIVVLCQVI